MTAEGQLPENRRERRRVAFEGPVRLRYDLFQEFLQENAANISSGGMFIRTIHPGEPGSELDFEIRLDDDFTLIQGRGKVVWVERGDGPSGRPAGMGIRFLELPEPSRALVERIVEERVAAGLELFDLDGAAPAERPRVPAPGQGPIWDLGGGEAADLGGPRASDTAAPRGEGSSGGRLAAAPAEPPSENLAALDPVVPAAAAVPAGSAASAARDRTRSTAALRRPGPARLILLSALSAMAGAGAVLAFYWLHVQPSIDQLETRIEELAGAPGGPWRPPAEEPRPPSPAEPPPAGEAAGRSGEVIDALRRWADAWSEQRADDYLACYAASFEPPGGVDRAAWEASRRARIARPEWIRVALTLVQVEPDGADAATVRFVQSYRSERYKDLVKKRLRMVREAGGWKIAAERVEP